MAERRKAPKGCYWRGATLWGGVTVQGRKVRSRTPGTRKAGFGRAMLLHKATEVLNADFDQAIADEIAGLNALRTEDECRS